MGKKEIFPRFQPVKIVYGHFSHMKTVFIDLFAVKKCLFAHASLETGNPRIEITSHYFSITLLYSFLDLTRYIAMTSIPFHLNGKLVILKFLILQHQVTQTNQEQNATLKEADFHEIANKSILFNIKVEQFTTSTTKYFVKSMARLISSFYVFNVEYPSKIENT